MLDVPRHGLRRKPRYLSAADAVPLFNPDAETSRLRRAEFVIREPP